MQTVAKRGDIQSQIAIKSKKLHFTFPTVILIGHRMTETTTYRQSLCLIPL